LYDDTGVQGADNTNSNTTTFTLPAGQSGAKSVTEASPTTGWTPDVTCSGTNAAKSNGNRTVAFTVSAGDNIKCDYVNQQWGTIQVTKRVLDADGNETNTDSGRFNLLVDDNVQARDVTNGGHTDVLTVDPGVTHAISETAGTKTSLGDYQASYACTDGESVINPLDITKISVKENHHVSC